RRDHPFSKRSTDCVVMNPGTQFKAVIEFCNLAISQLINSGDPKAPRAFYSCIAFLGKATQKTIRKRFDFLKANQIRCIPFKRQIGGTAAELLAQFVEHHTVKARFRNTWNDLLILSTALESSAILVTLDKVLGTFAGPFASAPAEWKGDFLFL